MKCRNRGTPRIQGDGKSMTQPVKRKNIKLVVKYSNSFSKRLHRAICDEISVAQKKWGVTLTESEKKRVQLAAMEQLHCKISNISRSVWDEDERTIVLNARISPVVANVLEDSLEDDYYLNLPMDASKKAKCRHYYVHRGSQGLSVDTDGSDNDAMTLPRLHLDFMNMMVVWARTAVMYGVGSYTHRRSYVSRKNAISRHHYLASRDNSGVAVDNTKEGAQR